MKEVQMQQWDQGGQRMGKLPGWAEVPKEKKKELILTLSGMVVKQRLVRAQTEVWGRHERG